MNVILLPFQCCCRSPCVGNNSSKAEQLESVKGTFVCHPVKPIETMSPRMVQPEMGTLWKCSAGEPRTKTLLQSRCVHSIIPSSSKLLQMHFAGPSNYQRDQVTVNCYNFNDEHGKSTHYDKEFKANR